MLKLEHCSKAQVTQRLTVASYFLTVVQVKTATGQESSRTRLSPTRSIRSWVTPPATPPPYTPLIQTTPSARSTPGLVHRGFWNSQQASDWSTRSPSLLKVPPRLCGHHLQQRSSAHSLVEAVSDAIWHWMSSQVTFIAICTDCVKSASQG